jgi:hypothetical protein
MRIVLPSPARLLPNGFPVLPGRAPAIATGAVAGDPPVLASRPMHCGTRAGDRRRRSVTRAHLIGHALAGCLVAACDAGPLAVQPRAGANTQSAGVEKTPISGTTQFLSVGPPGRSVTTPSDRCHVWHVPVATAFDGDVAGVVTFDQQQHRPCDFSDLSASGPFGGEVTWNGRSGTIAGRWTTNCVADASQPVGLSCEGTMNARGSGGLAGVQFHFDWGPGWYPFTYTGTAFSR